MGDNEMRMTRLIATFLLTATAAAAQAQGATAQLATASASRSTIASEQTFDAAIEAVNRSTVSAQTGGRVVEINFDVDDYVTKGAVLLRLRDTEQRANLKAAEARHQEARATFERARDLLPKELISRSDYDKAEAAVKSAAAALEQAREQMEHTVVRAPYSGMVVERHIEVGETANPGSPLMTGISLEQLRATASVPQAHIATVRAQAKARVLLPAGSIAARDLTISPYADPQSHTFKVRVNLPDGQHGVYPGMFAKVAFVTGEESRLLVPASAVVNRSEVTAVYVVKQDGTVSFRQIRAGARRGDQVEVLAGLDENEQVALDPIAAGVALKEQRAGGKR